MPITFILSHRYNCSLSKDGSYTFNTDSGIKYIVSFDQNNDHIPSYPGIIAEISFGPVNENERKNIKKKQKELDIKVRNTICFLIDNYLSQEDTNVLLYICESVDHRHCERNKLFNDWYELLNVGVYEKFDSILQTPDLAIYNSMIIRKDNPFKKNLLDGYFAALNLYTK